MRLSISKLIVAAFAAVAAGLLSVGGWLAQRETIERMERDRGVHEQLAADLEAELRRLDQLYETHLRTLLSAAKKETGATFAAACRNIVGVRHFSRLHAKPHPRDLQLDCRLPGAAPVAAPVFEGGDLFPSIPRREMVPEQFFGRATQGGRWLREPGRPALFFTEHARAIHLFSIEESDVRAAIDSYLTRWLAEPFGKLAVTEAGDRVLAPSKNTLIAAVGKSGGPPDWVLPVRSQFGTWRVESWDPRVARQEWHAPTLTGAVALALLVMGVGLTLAARVRRERILAEQRVSFVNRVSHELRTPLTNIMLNLDLAGEGIEEFGPRRRMGLAREEAGRLGRLIDNVLTFSRKERGAVELQPRACAPATVVQKVLDQFGPAFERRGIIVHPLLEAARACLMDPDALAQIVANLLSNVEKYVSGGAVHLQLRYHDPDLVLLVSDNGPGIPAAAAERAFLPFERLDSRITEGATGTGLGLAIARDLATRMGGTLLLLPSSVGATFELRIPAPLVPDLRASSAA